MYFLAALKEENPNYTFQQKTDKIGYRKALITVPSDTAYVLNMFKEAIDYRFKRARQVSYNKLAFGYEGSGETMEIKLLSDVPEDFISTITKETEKDTLNYWYRPKLEADSLVFEIRNKQFIDTLVVKIKDFMADSLVIKPLGSTLKLLESYRLSATIPLESLDVTKIQVMDKDSLVLDASMKFDTINNIVDLDFEKTEKNNYNIQMLPGAFIDFYGSKNDTLNFTANTKLQETYGAVRVEIRNGIYPLIVQLTTDKDEVVESYQVQEASPVDFQDVTPGMYSLRVVFDSNNNGAFDSGNYLAKTQPERVSYASKLVEVRAGWDTIEEFILED
jgi:hypothetical protein